MICLFSFLSGGCSSGTINHDDPEKPASNAKRVTAAVIVSAAEIYDGMVDAFSIMSMKTADATKSVISHKFHLQSIQTGIELQIWRGGRSVVRR